MLAHVREVECLLLLGSTVSCSGQHVLEIVFVHFVTLN